MIRTSTCWVKAKEIEFTSVNGEAAENSPHFLAKKIKSVVFPDQESRREGWTDARSAVGFCLGSGLFGSYNSD